MEAQTPASVTVRMIATLHLYRRELGLPVRVTLDVPQEGTPAVEIARSSGWTPRTERGAALTSAASPSLERSGAPAAAS